MSNELTKLQQFLQEQQERILKLAEEIHYAGASIKLMQLFLNNQESADRQNAAPQSQTAIDDEKEYPKLAEAIKCIPQRYKDRVDMAKLVISNRHSGPKAILKLCQELGWISVNTGLSNVRFIGKILDLFHNEGVSQ